MTTCPTQPCPCPRPREQPDVDWSVVSDGRIRNVARNAARAVGRRYGDVAEVDDLYQEALLLLAQSPDTVRGYQANLGRLHHWLWCDLTNLARRWAVRQRREISYEALRRGAE